VFTRFGSLLWVVWVCSPPMVRGVFVAGFVMVGVGAWAGFAEPKTIVLEGKGYSISERMKSHRVAGCSVVVVRDFKVKSVQNFGVTQVGRANLVVERTLFPAGQMSEPVAHALALKLVDDGVLALDEPVRNQLKRYTPPRLNTELTLRHLLLGRGGYSMPKFMGFEANQPVPNLADLVKNYRVESDPGAMWHRSPENVSVMQILMEDATGKPLQQLFAEVFGKGSSRYLAFPPNQGYTAFAQGHDAQGKPEPNGGRAYPELAASGLWTTAREFASILCQIMACAEGRSARPLRKSTAQFMFQPLETLDSRGEKRYEEAVSFGSDRLGGKKVYLRGGATRGYYCQSWLNPKRGHAILIFTNRQLAFDFANEVRDSLISHLD